MSQPNSTRHHADWLSLVEVSGPFVSLPVILRVFPHGLDPREPAQAKALRAAYEEWQDNPTAAGKQHAWVRHVLTTVLGYPQDLIAEGQALPAGMESSMPEMGETLRPDFALVGPSGSDTAGQVQLLIASYSDSQLLDKPVVGKFWKATPATRMMELLHGCGVSLGLVTNGEHWMMVYAPRGEITGYASWYSALWMDEPITLRAFHSLLDVRRFFGVSEDNTLLALLKESASDQQEVTDQLGYQVREAVKVLVQSFDALDKESGRTLLKGVSPSDQYDASLTVMMRLVFLFSAEERGMLHLGKPLYDDNYAVSTLQEQLQEVADQHGEEVLERRYDAWARLLATFRAIHGGVHHQDLMMQAYGGSLFNPDRYPFLEGRPAGSTWRSTSAQTLEVNNRVVLHLLNSLQRLRTKTGGMAETRRVSFRALGVEQIGHVYEGLLDHTAVLAKEPVLGIIGTRKKEPEILLATLESLLVQGQDKFFEYLKDETGKAVSVLRKAFDAATLNDEHKLLISCEQDEALLARLRPYAGLIREDSFDRPLVIVPGSVYVTAGTTRRSTGTHYTPPSLTEPIVQHTLEPLVYEGPADDWSRDQWKLRSPKEILDLRVCDMAMGSGAFLVQVCRYLAERLVEAWEIEEKKHPGEVLITPEGKFSAGAPSERLVPVDPNERIAIARRVVADRCLYGVDINPMAVEMAKLSLWLITLDANRPFTFLDHAFKCGDSLLGITSLDQLENFSLRPGGGKQQAFATVNLRQHIDEAKKKREELESMPSDTPEQVTVKAALYAEAEESVAKLNAAADVLVAVELKGLKGRAYEAEREASADHIVAHWNNGKPELQEYAHQRLRHRRCFHWALDFPEIIQKGGFSAFVGNPPFLHGRRISTILGSEYLQCLKLYHEKVNLSADLVAYFVLRMFLLLRSHGCQGFISTQGIAAGDTRETSLDWILRKSAAIAHATPDITWTGEASVRICTIVVWKDMIPKSPLLAGKKAPFISSLLTSDVVDNRPHPFLLLANKAIVFTGTYVYGRGYVLSTEEKERFISLNSRNADRIRPFLRGEDINRRPEQKHLDWVIDFGDMSEAEARQWPDLFSHLEVTVKPERAKQTKQIHEACFWKHWDKRPELYLNISKMKTCLAHAYVGKHISFAFVDTNQIIAAPVPVFASEARSLFAMLQSSFHWTWVVERSSKIGERIVYAPSDCFQNFPLARPSDLSDMESIGHQYESSRSALMNSRNCGLTQLYNHVHDATNTSPDIEEFRLIQRKMDQVVASAYNWQDLIFDYDFHETKLGIRYTIPDAARREVLDRLLALNHLRHAEEEAEKAVQTATTPTKRPRKKHDSGAQVLMGF